MSLTSKFLARDRQFEFMGNWQAKIETVFVVCGCLILLAACQDSSAGETAENVVGIWTGAGGVYFQFNDDGTYSVATSVDSLTSLPVDYGDFRLDGTTFMFITNEESLMCAGQAGNYEVEMTEQGKIEFTLVEDPCGHRAGAMQRTTLSPYSP